MSLRRLAVVLVAALAAASAVAVAQTPDERASARDLVKKKGDAVVMVLATLRIRANVAGQEQTVDQQAQANGTVIDASGLTVLSLSTLEPDEMMSRTLSARMRPGTRVDVSSEPSNVRVHLADGREIPAKLVLRDQDLDLAFIRPAAPPSPPLPWVGAPVGRPGLLDLVCLIQRTAETTGWTVAATFGAVQFVIDKPRLYYQVVMPGLGAGSLGSPVFDPGGRFVGIVVVRDGGTRGPNSTAVLPAADILDVATQAQ